MLQILHNFVHNTNLDANGFSLHAMKSVKLIRNLVETPSEQRRAFAIAEGFVLSEAEHVTMDGLQVDGMRIGFNFANEDDNLNTYLVKDCTAKNCALGKWFVSLALVRGPFIMHSSFVFPIRCDGARPVEAAHRNVGICGGRLGRFLLTEEPGHKLGRVPIRHVSLRRGCRGQS